MNQFASPWRIIRGAAFGGLGLVLTGCTVHEHHYAREYRREEVIAGPRYEERTVVEERFEPAPREVVTVYERDLEPYGRWVEVREYGRCWVPHRRPSGWRPYTVGHYVSTDGGWCWEAEDDERDWGVITYHYGRWYEDREYGWVWVPGSTWAPAWVAWREGGGYCGWAPLPPTIGSRREIDSVYVERYVPADRYVYVEERYITEPRVHSHVVYNNTTIINKTTNITNITVVNGRAVNRGVAVGNVERSTGRRVENIQVTEVTSATEARRLRAEGRAVAYQPESVKRADEEYRQRVERRVADNAAAKTAEHERVTRRETDAQIAERERVQRRVADEAAAKKAENERALRRDQEAAAAKKAEQDRVLRRETDQQLSERERIARRAKEDAAAKTAEHDRVLRREKDTAAAETAAEAEKKAAHDRAVRRAEEAKKAEDAKKAAGDANK
jgi:hypothetical protein